MFYLFGNWKSYKNLNETRTWFEIFRETLSARTRKSLENEEMEIIIFPPSPLMYPLHTLSIGFPGVRIGSQDVSPAGEGKETGLINASSLQGIASYVIVGHVEQRKRGDTQEVVMHKYKQAYAHNVTPVLCASKPSEIMPESRVLAYEPVNAIGSGNNATVGDVLSFKKFTPHNAAFIYGGSVNETNCAQYLQSKLVDGFLIGAISLDAARFSALADACIPYVAK